MADLAWWLQHFQASAFRLEVRPVYSVPQEAEMLATFRRDGSLPDMTDHPWVKRVREHCGAGRQMGRVRAVSRPLTDYERFELELYPHSHAAGEEIRLVERDALEVTPDFWLFDDQTAIMLRYDSEGRFLGTDEGDPSLCRHWREVSLARSIPLEEYLARL
jgi:hypothetical protein